MIKNRHHIAIALMLFGLALLGVFLWLFLQKTWDDKAANLRRDTNLLFVNAVRNIESQVFDKLIVQQWSNQHGDSTLDISIKMPPRRDSAKTITFIEEKSIITSKIAGTRDSNKTQIQITVADKKMPDDPAMKGALSMFVFNHERDSVRRDSLDPQVLKMVQFHFGAAMQQSGLPVAWQVIRAGNQPDSSAASGAAFMAGEYFDLASHERLGAQISQYDGYLYQQMLPTIGFSVLLFVSVALAFLFVYQSFRQQFRLTELKNDFIRNMTHELKTPIATVSVAIEALQHFDALQNPARTREYLDISQQELNRLSLLVDKVLQMSLFEQGEPQLKSEPLDLKALIEEVLAAMRIQFEKYGANVHFMAEGDAFGVQGDRLHLVSVLYNLLDNALKYSQLSPKINIHLIRENTALVLKVADNGRGIPAAYQTRIFEKFFRVPMGDVHDVKGHGLGLSYVASVVQQHGGAIEVKSMESEGTEFTVRLPV